MSEQKKTEPESDSTCDLNKKTSKLRLGITFEWRYSGALWIFNHKFDVTNKYEIVCFVISKTCNCNYCSNMRTIPIRIFFHILIYSRRAIMLRFVIGIQIKFVANRERCTFQNTVSKCDESIDFDCLPEARNYWLI